MSWLFKITENTVYPNEESLFIPEVKKIWERDKSPKKETALKELAYCEFMTSYLRSNPFRGYSDDIKEFKIKKEIIRDDKWKPDKEVLSLIAYIDNLQEEGSDYYTLLKATLIAKTKIEKLFKSADLEAVNDKGGLLYKPKDFTSAMLDVDKCITSLAKLRKQVEEDLFEITKNRAGKEINFFATKDSFNYNEE